MNLKEQIRRNGQYLGGGYARNVFRYNDFAYKIQRISENRDYDSVEYRYSDRLGQQQNIAEWNTYQKIKEKEYRTGIKFDLIPSIEYTEGIIKMELMEQIAEDDTEFYDWRENRRTEMMSLTSLEEYIQFCREEREVKNIDIDGQLIALKPLGVLNDVIYKPENFGYSNGYIKIIDLGFLH